MDSWVIPYLSRIANAAPGLHAFLVEHVVANDLLKGGVLVALLWWLWMKRHPDQVRRRELLIAAVIGALGASLASRAFARLVPFRSRPFETEGLDLAAPLQKGWEVKGGSFPSDHMALAFAIVTGIAFVSPPLGAAVALYVLVVVAAPRVLVALHWPTDIIGGAVLGIAVTSVLAHPRIRAALARPLLRWHGDAPHAFYAAMFVVSFGLMTRFDDFRSLAGVGARAIIAVVQSATASVVAAEQ